MTMITTPQMSTQKIIYLCVWGLEMSALGAGGKSGREENRHQRERRGKMAAIEEVHIQFECQ
jgi:hypothetical protein